MTVREAIAALQKHPPDAICIVNLAKNELANGKELREVRRTRAYRHTDTADAVWHEDYYPEIDRGNDEDEYYTVVDLTA